MKKLIYWVSVAVFLAFSYMVIDCCIPDADAHYRGGRGGYHGGRCFIATAAYGDANHQHVMILREFRDRYLLTNDAGAYMVEMYYQHSPAAATFISEHDYLKPAIRVGLLPIVGVGYLLNRF